MNHERYKVLAFSMNVKWINWKEKWKAIIYKCGKVIIRKTKNYKLKGKVMGYIYIWISVELRNFLRGAFSNFEILEE